MYGWCLLLLQIGTFAPDAFARSVSGTIGTNKAARSANGTIASDRGERSANDTNASGSGSEGTFDVDKIIANVLRSSNKTFTKLITPKDIQQLCHVAQKVLNKKTTLAEIAPPIFLFGPVHGQYSDLLRMFNKIGYPTGDKKYMFIGDFVDRGNQSLEVGVLLMSYMVREEAKRATRVSGTVKYADTFVLLRGNHEVASVNEKYGFKKEIEERYGEAESNHTYWSFNKAFALLPFAGLVGNKILCKNEEMWHQTSASQPQPGLQRIEKNCMHGGISPKILSLQQLRNLNRTMVEEVTEETVENDLLWADPNENITGVIFNKGRGTSVYFGMDVVESLLKRLDIDRIVRAHEVWPGGIKYFAGGRLISVFSAPRYQGKRPNTAAVLHVAADLKHTAIFFKPNYGTPATPINATTSATISTAPTNGTAYTLALRCWLNTACQSITIESAKLGGRFKVIDCDGALKKLETADYPIILALGNEFVGSKDGIFLREYVP
uniref:Serine/threonine-protein phosphatase n=1 Tax=Globodera rostochiensis TaxID=31243 RepID=A0A914HWJ3_GLORO